MSRNSFKGIESFSYLAPCRESLERSCADGPSAHDRIERLEARLLGRAYAPHRHDTYALGLTLKGVQTFSYRGREQVSLPGNVIILHPDEVHDGAAGTDETLVYRMIYLPPELISAAFDYRRSLPFSADPVVSDPLLWSALADLLRDLETQSGELLLDDAIARIGDCLLRHDHQPSMRVGGVAREAVLRARDLLDAHFQRTVASPELEAAAGLDRFELSRHFRRVFGTSPHRYLVQRRLEHAKRSIMAGAPIASAAADAGFADQAHFTRQFTGSFGVPPGRWLAAQRLATTQ